MATLSRTLAELTSRIRQRSAQVNSQFVTDSEIAEMVNGSHADLMDHVQNVAGPEGVADVFTVSTVAGTDLYELTPTSGPGGTNLFYRILGIDWLYAGEWCRLRNLQFADRNRLQLASGWTSAQRVFYRRAGHDSQTGRTFVHFYPTPEAVHSLRVWFTPIALDLDGSVTFPALNGWEEYVICDVAAKILEKEESDSRALIARRERALKNIKWAAANLDDSGTTVGVQEVVEWAAADLPTPELWRSR